MLKLYLYQGPLKVGLGFERTTHTSEEGHPYSIYVNRWVLFKVKVPRMVQRCIHDLWTSDIFQTILLAINYYTFEIADALSASRKVRLYVNVVEG